MLWTSPGTTIWPSHVDLVTRVPDDNMTLLRIEAVYEGESRSSRSA